MNIEKINSGIFNEKELFIKSLIENEDPDR